MQTRGKVPAVGSVALFQAQDKKETTIKALERPGIGPKSPGIKFVGQRSQPLYFAKAKSVFWHRLAVQSMQSLQSTCNYLAYTFCHQGGGADCIVRMCYGTDQTFQAVATTIAISRAAEDDCPSEQSK